MSETSGGEATSSGKRQHQHQQQHKTKTTSSTTNGSFEKHSGDESVKNNAELTTSPEKTSVWVIVASIAMITISYVTFPGIHNLRLHPHLQKPTVQHVWYFGWISALSTGLGVVPLVFARKVDSFWIGISNAIASGMMIAASYSLLIEGSEFDEPNDNSTLSPPLRTTIGTFLGLIFILSTKQFLHKHEELKVGNLSGADARKVLLIIFVMTLHSFSEGVGIGVSFGGQNGSELGMFISASLAVHNVPEGLAVAIVLLPRGVSWLTCAVWCVGTSLPQPLMAVPAFLFVNSFIPILPVGLGFAGGAMAWVAVFELWVEAWEDTESLVVTGVVSTISLGMMLGLQGFIDEGSRS